MEFGKLVIKQSMRAKVSLYSPYYLPNGFQLITFCCFIHLTIKKKNHIFYEFPKLGENFKNLLRTSTM